MHLGPRYRQIFFGLIAITLSNVGPIFAQNMRPALVGNGPKALINLINGKHVIDRGVKHGALFFMARVDPNGFPSYSKVWGMTKETEPLRDELRERLAEARFIPAVYNGKNVWAWFYGTCAFSTTDGKPHLRIFANQELPELEKESDFIAPQPIWLPGKNFEVGQWKDPFGSWWTGDKPGIAYLLLSVDSSGKITGVKVEKVDPPEANRYGEEAVKRAQQWLCLPAYRNGKPVDSVIHFRWYYIPVFHRLQ